MDSIVTGLFALAGALGAVWLGQWHARRQAAQARSEARRDAQRKVIAELIIAARTKVTQFDVYLPALAKSNDDDLSRYADTDSGREMRENNSALERAIMEALLLVGDEPLAGHIRTLSEINTSFPEEAVGPALEASKPNGDFEDLLRGMRYVSKLAKAASQVQLEAMPLLQAPLTVVENGKPWRVSYLLKRGKPRPR